MRPTSPRRDEPDLACPRWCRREHAPDARADDLLHQSRPAFTAVVHGDPLFARHGDEWTDTVVLRLVQRVGSHGVWLDAASEEGRSLRLLVTAESAQRLATAMADLIALL